jgi:hypothetical protein
MTREESTSFHPNAADIERRADGAVHVASPVEQGVVAAGPAWLHRLPRFDDPRGTIVVNQAPEQLPFVPTRIFQVFDVPEGEMRGDHAHRRCHQFIMALTGSVLVVVDDGRQRFSVRLDEPHLGLHVPPLTWSIQRDFAPGSRVLVLASEPYDRAEYIDDYAEFTGVVEARSKPR